MITIDSEQSERIHECLIQIAEVLNSHGLTLTFGFGNLRDDIKGTVFPIRSKLEYRGDSVITNFEIYKRKNVNRKSNSKGKK